MSIMPTMKSLVAGSALVGAAVISADAFVAPGAPSQRGAPSALRGATQKSTSTQYGAYTTAGVTAAGIAMLGSFAVSARRRCGSSKCASTIVCNFSKENQLGAQDPLGFWDPLNLCDSEATFKDFRAKEIKHGRLAMMGALGMLTQSVVQVPGMEGVPKGIDAALVGNGQVGFIGTLAIIAGLEAAVFVQDPNKEPGEFDDPLNLGDFSMEMRAKELNNGRIAMFAALGIISAGLYTGKPALEQFGL
mmetsp:Transcript_114681/g.255945  ORF Transcript_114681/g.255945 Transcript_114681/m.255945 type:complete len:247 (-) Transcript_114681:404-1144(-)